MSGPGNLLPFSPLRSAFDVTEYKYDESQFAVYQESCLDNIDPQTFIAPNGIRVGAAEFVEVQADPGLSFRVDERGEKVPVLFNVLYKDLPKRIESLKRLGIRPSQSEKAMNDLNAQLHELRRKAGLTGKVLQFPCNRS